MKKEVCIITALACEAAPLISAWGLKPLREDPVCERFQVFYSDGIYVAISGIGKIRSATATTALLSGVFAAKPAPIVANIGIAGATTKEFPLGSLTYVTKIRDHASNQRLYPDIILKHGLPELPLDTHDQPVTTPSTETVLVDMEASGFLHAALTFLPPSHVCVLKVISDYCSGERITPSLAEKFIEGCTASIDGVLKALRNELPEILSISKEDEELLTSVANHASLSLSQRIELSRVVRALKAQGIAFESTLEALLATPIESKAQRNHAFGDTLQKLSGALVT